jgi:hypothetical protein
MYDLLESLGKRLVTEWKSRSTAKRLSHAYLCQCGTADFFPNTLCLNCNSPLGYLPDARGNVGSSRAANAAAAT